MNATPRENRARLESLRELMAGKFPARGARPERWRRIGCERLDGEHGGLRQGAVTEITGSASGVQILLSAILRGAASEGFHVGLVDGTSSFHPADWPDAQLRRILWVMCRDAATAVRAADLLVRDGNLPLVVLDLQGIAAAGLRGVPASTWHRFHRILEEREAVLLVLTSQPLVEGVPTRIVVEPAGGLDARLQERSCMVTGLGMRVFERRIVGTEEGARKIA
jgi:hypothetical protein